MIAATAATPPTTTPIPSARSLLLLLLEAEDELGEAACSAVVVADTAVFFPYPIKFEFHPESDQDLVLQNLAMTCPLLIL